jgi:DNA-binding MarR family transcriptional regulator
MQNDAAGISLHMMRTKERPADLPDRDEITLGLASGLPFAGFMRSLALFGPLTVPQIAQIRPTSRQRMQRLADELAAEGLVKLIDNPKHRRLKLVQLTPKGDARYRELSTRLLSIASTMGVAFSEPDIHRTTEIVRQLSDDVKAWSAWKP